MSGEGERMTLCDKCKKPNMFSSFSWFQDVWTGGGFNICKKCMRLFKLWLKVKE